jgi:hypothetical protein
VVTLPLVETRLRSLPVALGAPERAMIHRCVRRLSRDFSGLLACRLAVDAPWPRRGERPKYTAQVELTLPGGVITVVQPASQDRFVLIQDALDAAARQLQGYAVHHRYQATEPAVRPTHHTRSASHGDRDVTGTQLATRLAELASRLEQLSRHVAALQRHTAELNGLREEGGKLKREVEEFREE